MPEVTEPNGAKPLLSRLRLSPRLMKICVVRVFGPADAKRHRAARVVDRHEVVGDRRVRPRLRHLRVRADPELDDEVRDDAEELHRRRRSAPSRGCRSGRRRCGAHVRCTVIDEVALRRLERDVEELRRLRRQLRGMEERGRRAGRAARAAAAAAATTTQPSASSGNRMRSVRRTSARLARSRRQSRNASGSDAAEHEPRRERDARVGVDVRARPCAPDRVARGARDRAEVVLLEGVRRRR